MHTAGPEGSAMVHATITLIIFAMLMTGCAAARRADAPARTTISGPVNTAERVETPTVKRTLKYRPPPTPRERIHTRTLVIAPPSAGPPPPDLAPPAPSKPLGPTDPKDHAPYVGDGCNAHAQVGGDTRVAPKKDGAAGGAKPGAAPSSPAPPPQKPPGQDDDYWQAVREIAGKGGAVDAEEIVGPGLDARGRSEAGWIATDSEEAAARGDLNAANPSITPLGGLHQQGAEERAGLEFSLETEAKAKAPTALYVLGGFAVLAGAALAFTGKIRSGIGFIVGGVAVAGLGVIVQHYPLVMLLALPIIVGGVAWFAWDAWRQRGMEDVMRTTEAFALTRYAPDALKQRARARLSAAGASALKAIEASTKKGDAVVEAPPRP